MATLLILQGAGPLPMKATFNAPADGPVTFVLSGTTTTESAPVLTGITLSLDGTIIGAPALCWANQNNNHMAMMPMFIPVDNLSYGEPHTVEVVVANENTNTDQNDYFQVVLLY